MITEIKIFDNSGILRKVQKENRSKQAIINLSSFNPGIYYVEISNGITQERQQIIIGKK